MKVHVPDHVRLASWVRTGGGWLTGTPPRLYVGFFLFAALLYSGTFGHGFVFDDASVLSKNQFVQQGLDGLPEILTRGSWDGHDPEKGMRIYRPLQLTVLALQFEFFGLNPAGYHVLQVLTYAGCCVLVLHLLLRLMSDREQGASIAMLASFLFLIHPVHTEVVSNIKGNGDLLAFGFGLLALISLDRYAEKGSWRYLLSAAVLYLVALLCKEVAVSLLGVALLHLFFFRGTTWRQAVLAGTAMTIPVLVYLGVRALVFGPDAQSLDNILSKYDNVLFMAEGLSDQVGTRLYALGKNLKLLFFPYPLQMMYVYDSVPVVGFFQMESLVPGLVYLCMGIVCLKGLLQKSLISYGIAIYLGTLALYTHTVTQAPNLVAERWLLIPSLGFCVGVAVLIHRCRPLFPKTVTGVTALLVFGYTGYTFQRSLEWESNVTLSRNDVWTAPNMLHAQLLLGKAAYEQALERRGDRELLWESARMYDRYVWELPNNYEQQNALAICYELLGEYAQAAIHYEKAADFPSETSEFSRVAQAEMLMKSNQLVNALKVLDRLQVNDPVEPRVQAMRILAESKLRGGAPGPEQKLMNLLEDHPREPWSNRFLAETFLRRAQQQNMDSTLLEKSVFHYQQWLYAAPGTTIMETEAYDKLAQILALLDRPEEAAAAFVYAARWHSPLREIAIRSAARNYMQAGMYSEALEQWSRLEPTTPTVVWGRVQSLMQLGRERLAVEEVKAFFRKEMSADVPEEEQAALHEIKQLMGNQAKQF